jgi:RNA polymerase sigma factor (sigma-70 family)
MTRTAAQRDLDRLWHQRRTKRKKRDRLATDNLHLVASIARRLKPTAPVEVKLKDLIGAGNLALLGAAARYDPANHNGTPASAFLRNAITGAMLDCMRAVSCDGTGGHALRPRLDSIDDPDLAEAQSGLARMAHQPEAPELIDRDRMTARIWAAVGQLRPAEQNLLRIWYALDEPGLYRIAQRLRITQEAATALHNNAILTLRARMTGGAIEREAA